MGAHQRRTVIGSALAGLTVACLSGGGLAPVAAAELDSEPEGRPGLVAVTRPLPDEISTAPLPDDQDSGLPAGVQDQLWDLYAAHPDINVNSLEWSSAEGKLFAYTAAAAEVEPLFEKHLSAVPVELVLAKHSKREIDAVLDQIASTGGDLGSGQRVVTAQPAKDGSTITLGVETLPGARGRTGAGDDVPALRSSIPLTIEEAPELATSMRNIGYYANFFSGAISTRPASSTSMQLCTTGFAIAHLSTGQPGMLSAEHCGRGNIGSTWYYSTVQVKEASLGQYQGMLGGNVGHVDTGIWLGGNLDAFYPAVFTGGNDGNSTLTAIRGAVVPVIGASVCYSGARSGSICGNRIEATGQLTCYSASQCYANQSITQQISNVPAVGNGDSGGPVYQSINGQPHGAGIISGIVNGGKACSGDPGDASRSCSTKAIFAPLNAALSSGQWGFKYIP
jgi:hypothetical protein